MACPSGSRVRGERLRWVEAAERTPRSTGCPWPGGGLPGVRGDAPGESRRPVPARRAGELPAPVACRVSAACFAAPGPGETPGDRRQELPACCRYRAVGLGRWRHADLVLQQLNAPGNAARRARSRRGAPSSSSAPGGRARLAAPTQQKIQTTRNPVTGALTATWQTVPVTVGEPSPSAATLRDRACRFGAPRCSLFLPALDAPIGQIPALLRGDCRPTSRPCSRRRTLRWLCRSSAAVSSGPFRSAIQRLIWVLEPRPSLLRMLVMWVSTVRSDKNSLAAICLLLRSSATSRAMSSCLRVRTACGRGLAAEAGRGGCLPSTAKATPSSIVIARPRANAASNDFWPSPWMAADTDARAVADTVPSGSRH